MAGSDILLNLIAIRFAAVALTGLTLLVLPARPRDDRLTCFRPLPAGVEAQAGFAAKHQAPEDEIFRDMLLHD